MYIICILKTITLLCTRFKNNKKFQIESISMKIIWSIRSFNFTNIP